MKYVNLAVATPARLEVRRVGEGQEETGVVEVVEGEVVEVQCVATGAFPRAEFLWSLPGVERVETSEVSSELLSDGVLRGLTGVNISDRAGGSRD